MGVDGIRQRGRPRNTGLYEMNSLLVVDKIMKARNVGKLDPQACNTVVRWLGQ